MLVIRLVVRRPRFNGGGNCAVSCFIVEVLIGCVQIPSLYAQRSIVHKQQRAAMYHPLIEAAAMTLVDIPITFVTIVFFTLIIYFFVGLQKSAEQYL